ncbi:MAG: hypothetical protein BM563_04395 [Bacteroidetes bacterium MedPE-SWsnd-G1]|nr:MAG: hypothetical protein BM563_04395 [Bacteroidetes bacterium MedPE-SWsnd-G1]
MKTKTEQNNAFLIHISALAGYFFPLGGIVAPLIFWQVKKDESAYLDEQGKEAVNFNLSFFLYQFILGLTFIPLFIRSIFRNVSNLDHMHNDFFFDFPNVIGFFGGISLIGILGLIRFVLIILAAVKANKGEDYKYPITIKFIK